jgi:hypothetical protein
MESIVHITGHNDGAQQQRQACSQLTLQSYWATEHPQCDNIALPSQMYARLVLELHFKGVHSPVAAIEQLEAASNPLRVNRKQLQKQLQKFAHLKILTLKTSLHQRLDIYHLLGYCRLHRQL